MMPLGPQFTQLFNNVDDQFGLVISASSFLAGASGLLVSVFINWFSCKKLRFALCVLLSLATLACLLQVLCNWLKFQRPKGVCVHRADDGGRVHGSSAHHNLYDDYRWANSAADAVCVPSGRCSYFVHDTLGRQAAGFWWARHIYLNGWRCLPQRL